MVLFSNRLTLFLASAPGGTSFSDAEIVHPSSVHNGTIYKRWELAPKTPLSSLVSLVFFLNRKSRVLLSRRAVSPVVSGQDPFVSVFYPPKLLGSQPGLPACPIAEHFVAQGHMPGELSAL